MKELKSKFIEGTNEQYSIREDLSVIKHNKNKKKDKILKLDVNNSIRIIVNKKLIRFNPRTLMQTHFGFNYCKRCNNKYIRDKQTSLCTNCSRPSYNERYMQQVVSNVEKSYVAGIFKVKTKEFPYDIYNLYRENLLFKRKVAKENNMSIRSFNK